VEKVLRTAVRVVMKPALRLIQGDAHQRSEQTRSCPVIRASEYPTKLTEPRLGCAKLLGLPLLPIMGLPNRWVTDCS